MQYGTCLANCKRCKTSILGVRFPTESLVFSQVNMLKDCRFCVVSWLWHHNDWQSCACFSESPCFFWHGIDLRSSTFSLGGQGVSLAKNHRIQLLNLFLAHCRLTVFVRCTTRKFRCLFPLLFHSTDHCLTIGP